jgi:4-hydroxybenzoate polyprenyltransferase
MVELLVNIAKTSRPRQWVKNLTLFAALLFTGNLLPTDWIIRDFKLVVSGVISFTVVASSIYFLNDIVDAESDKVHPFKKYRPIASGKIPIWLAVSIFVAGSVVGLGYAKILSPLFFLIVGGYWLMQILYSIWLKNIEVVDVFVIALGFFLRVLAGGIIINAHLSIWFLLCVISVSLFLAVGKRRAEMAILHEQGAVTHRKVMKIYSASILDSYLVIFATSSFLSWALFTFNFYETSGPSATPSTLILLSKTLTINKWLMATIPVVIFGIMRYIRIIYDGARAETPEKVILQDFPLLITVAIWALMVVGVLYIVPS